jgi:3',5'-cyclic AMP phosphodiesterase CpdA
VGGLGGITAKRGTPRTAAVLALAALLAGCATSGPGAGSYPAPVGYPAVRFAVIADPHLFDAAASTPGPAFDQATGSDMKLHAESREILAEAIAAIAAERPDFLLVCGDLTRDGERSAHELAAAMLGELDDAGVPVLVVPGNHDVRNPAAARFAGERVEPAASVAPEEFAAIYAGLGYAEGLERDPASLSYVAEPVPGLRVLALDACRYRGEPGSPRTDGRLSRATRAWAARVLARARVDGVATIVFLHHAVVPHFTGMERWLDPYLLDGHDAAARFLASAGVRLAFTGHGHAQDVVRGATREGPIWDVETGSLAARRDRSRRCGEDFQPAGNRHTVPRQHVRVVCRAPGRRRIMGRSPRRPGSQRRPRRAGIRHRPPGGRGRLRVLCGRRARAGRTGRPFGAEPVVLPR